MLQYGILRRDFSISPVIFIALSGRRGGETLSFAGKSEGRRGLFAVSVLRLEAAGVVFGLDLVTVLTL